MALADIADARELREAELATRFAEGLERILCLPRHDDVADQTEKVVLTYDIGEIPGDAKRHSSGLFHRALVGAQRALVLLEHALMLLRSHEKASTQIAKAHIFGLRFVVLHGLDERPVLDDRIVHLAFQELEAVLHGLTPRPGRRRMVQVARPRA